MEQYRFDPYTGQPLRNPRSASAYPATTWAPQGWSNQPQPTAQPTRQEQPGIIVRPVASYDEAKAVPTDFSGALTVMPDWGHGYIYVKALGDNGIPVLGIYHDINAAKNSTPLPAAEPAPAVEYAPLEELEQLREEVKALREELAAAKAPVKEMAEKGKGSKA